MRNLGLFRMIREEEERRERKIHQYPEIVME
jgi:hypothetical protein